MQDEVQSIVDALSTALGRTVSVSDYSIRHIAHSKQMGAVDQARIDSVLRRRVSPQLQEFIYSQGARSATRLFEVGANESLDAYIARFGYPVTAEGRTMGFIWLLQTEGPIGADEEKTVAEAAASISRELRRQAHAGRARDSALKQHLADALSPDPDQRTKGAEALAQERLFGAQASTLLVLEFTGTTGASPAQLGMSASLLLERFTDWFSLAPGLFHESADHSVVLLGADFPDDSVRQWWQGELGDQDVIDRVGIGLGSALEDLRDTETTIASYRHALTAARIALTTDTAPVALRRWSELGYYGLLPEANAETLATPIATVIASLVTDHPDLAETLERYLDAAGDVRATASAMYLHRGSLYNRLKRIEQLTGLDLGSGGDRLAAHMGLKLLRTTGQLSWPETVEHDSQR
ncbi:PucR family transcriptional regulator [Brevibacterium sp. 2SA]|uniref:PucR family transcriptional regulator n=1 Tax=Brevibacterium sp. 2SA TaxID=2502198 RepID=UPI0010F7651B|nr:PucR family transcriptional regulator [Brevibacterium sp. 2SA]